MKYRLHKMLIHAKILQIQFFSKDRIVADRQIVRLLSNELYVRKKHYVSDYFFRVMDSFEKSKSRQELKHLSEIMVLAINKGELFTKKKFADLEQRLLKLSNYSSPPWALPDETKRKLL